MPNSASLFKALNHDRNMTELIEKLTWLKSDEPEFIALSDYAKYNSSLFNKFVRFAPNSQSDGFYRVKLFGKISNAGWEGYLPTLNYFLYQLKCVKNFAFAVVESMASGSDFSVLSIVLLVIGFILGILIRLPIGIALTIIQFAVLPIVSKSEEKTNASI